MNRKFAFMAIPMMTALMIGVSYNSANASGIYCGEGEPVAHGIANTKSAYANFEGLPGNLGFGWGQENCNNETGEPSTYGYSYWNIGGCYDYVEITKDNFEWGYELTVLTLDGTICGDIRVEWVGDGEMLKNEYKDVYGDNCHDGKTVYSYMSKYQYATAEIYVDGVLVSTSVDPTDARIWKGSDMVLKCETGDSP